MKQMDEQNIDVSTSEPMPEVFLIEGSENAIIHDEPPVQEPANDETEDFIDDADNNAIDEKDAVAVNDVKDKDKKKKKDKDKKSKKDKKDKKDKKNKNKNKDKDKKKKSKDSKKKDKKKDKDGKKSKKKAQPAVVVED